MTITSDKKSQVIIESFKLHFRAVVVKHLKFSNSLKATQLFESILIFSRVNLTKVGKNRFLLIKVWAEVLKPGSWILWYPVGVSSCG